MSEDYAERTLRTVINLGRYGELFAYDEPKLSAMRTLNRQGLPKLIFFGLTCSGRCAAASILHRELPARPKGELR